MKRQRKDSQAQAAESPQPATTAVLPAKRRRWFRIIGVLSPVALLVVAEIGLRLGGYGYPASFFLERTQENRRIFVQNPKFGWRFFPPGLARSPLPLKIAATKPPGTVRIVVFGESAAMGDPEPAYGLSRQLERMLQARHPDKQIEVVNVAMTAINSHVIREIAKDCARLNADLWLIYAGNNEVVGPFGAGTIFGRQAAPLLSVRLILALKTTRLGQWLASRGIASAERGQWEGMAMFLRQQVPHDDARLARVYENFGVNLRDVVARGRKSGSKVVLATLPVNLKDCPPFASAHSSGMSAAALDKWQRPFARGVEAEAQQRYGEAIMAYHEAAQIDSGFAELAFRRARCELASGGAETARDHYAAARDLDTLRFRADRALNEIVRTTAGNSGASLVDVEKAGVARAKDGIPGDDLFYDHVHLNFAGTYWVAGLLLPEVEQQVFGPAPAKGSSPLSESEMVQRLAFTGFDYFRVGEEMRLRLQQPPFSAQLNFKDRNTAWQNELSAMDRSANHAIATYRTALALDPQDWVLHFNFGRVLDAAGESTAALVEWTEVTRLMPQEPDGWFQRGNLAYSARQYPEAATLFQEALARRPDSVEAMTGLGLVFAAQGRTDLAIRELERALKVDPQSTAARVNLGLILARQGDLTGAETQYRTALNGDTRSAAARINLAKLLTSRGETEEAIRLYEEAVRLKPDDPVAHYDLGNALVARNRHEEAAAHYAEAVKCRPDFPEAQYNLAVELARMGRVVEALEEFDKAVRLHPGSPEAHFNYGIALAKQERFAEAAKQFQETLKIQPTHANARAALQRAMQLSGGAPK